jgi:hypothetical protein
VPAPGRRLAPVSRNRCDPGRSAGTVCAVCAVGAVGAGRRTVGSGRVAVAVVAERSVVGAATGHGAGLQRAGDVGGVARPPAAVVRDAAQLAGRPAAGRWMTDEDAGRAVRLAGPATALVIARRRRLAAPGARAHLAGDLAGWRRRHVSAQPEPPAVGRVAPATAALEIGGAGVAGLAAERRRRAHAFGAETRAAIGVIAAPIAGRRAREAQRRAPAAVAPPAAARVVVATRVAVGRARIVGASIRDTPDRAALEVGLTALAGGHTAALGRPLGRATPRLAGPGRRVALVAAAVVVVGAAGARGLAAGRVRVAGRGAAAPEPREHRGAHPRHVTARRSGTPRWCRARRCSMAWCRRTAGRTRGTRCPDRRTRSARRA